MFSGSFLLVCGITSLASLILSIPTTTTNDLLSRLPPEIAEILMGQNLGEDVWETLMDEAESIANGEIDPDDPEIQLKPHTRTLQNLFNFSAIVANAPNDTAAITLVPLITILASIFNFTNNG